MKLNYFSKTVVGLVRKANEDCIGQITTPNKSNINLRIVCDGMGGHVGGAKASNIAVKSISEYFLNNPNPVPQIALNEAICFANLQIFGFAQAEPEFKGMGTTCTVLLEIEGLVYIAHVGDSRIYINTDKKLYRITKDHSYVQGLVDKGIITDQQMETHPKKNQLTRALGIGEEVKVEVASKPILAKCGDSFLLCSDGLNGLINDRMINSVINTNDTLETKCNNLITMAEAAGGHDNISVDLIEVLESEHINTQFVNKNNEDLIDTKTKQIIIDPTNQKKNAVGFQKNKLTIALITPIILFAAYFGYFHFQGMKGDSVNPPFKPETEKGGGDIITPTVTDTIKVVVEEFWAKSTLNEEFKIEVDKKVGEQNYCDDCPLFYRKGSNKPISIFKYRNQVKTINIGDYLIVTVSDGKIKLPKINEKKKIKKSEPKNMYSKVRKEKEQLKREKERLKREKEQLKREELENDRLENEKIKTEEAEFKVKKTEVDNSKNNKTQPKIITPVESKNKSVDTIKKKKIREKEEKKKSKKKEEKVKKERATGFDILNKK